ncbi:MAG: tyrosine-protein phosphatase [Candidatus Sericytochromatia bacterium]|nr:tyrosine-protein phosphatase [Candidatus Sericytochromatia bacterium]
MINGMRPLQFQAQTAPGGPNEQALLKDSHKLSFRVKQAIFGEVVQLTRHSARAERLSNKVIGFFAKPTDTPIPGNMSQVVPGLLRGAQPTQAGFAYLAKIGVKTVINLTDETNRDAAWVPAAGMKAIYIPQDGFAAPSDSQTRAFLQAATAPQNQPIFFHCYHGSDRTGTMAAAYRIAVQGWTADQAIAELGPHGFNTSAEMDKLKYIHQFAAQWQGKAKEFLASGH